MPSILTKNIISNTYSTNTTLVIGNTYKITTYTTDDNFTNVGAASNTVGTIFVAKATTATTWTTSVLVENPTYTIPDGASCGVLTNRSSGNATIVGDHVGASVITIKTGETFEIPLIAGKQYGAMVVTPGSTNLDALLIY